MLGLITKVLVTHILKSRHMFHRCWSGLETVSLRGSGQGESTDFLGRRAISIWDDIALFSQSDQEDNGANNRY